MLACSEHHVGIFQPAVARLFVAKFDDVSRDLPVVCIQCGLCAKACPEEAIEKSPENVYFVVESQCTGCGECIAACPRGMIKMDSQGKFAVKCNLCEGIPSCIEACPYEALSTDTKKSSSSQNRKRAESLPADLARRGRS